MSPASSRAATTGDWRMPPSGWRVASTPRWCSRTKSRARSRFTLPPLADAAHPAAPDGRTHAAVPSGFDGVDVGGRGGHHPLGHLALPAGEEALLVGTAVVAARQDEEFLRHEPGAQEERRGAVPVAEPEDEPLERHPAFGAR